MAVIIEPQGAGRKRSPEGSTGSSISQAYRFPPNMAFSGEMVIDGDVVIDHVQDGIIEGRRITVGPRADVAGTVIAARVEVEGRVEGAIYAEQVVLSPTAFVEGELWFRELTLSPGAWFEGKSRQVDNPRVLANRLPRQLVGLVNAKGSA